MTIGTTPTQCGNGASAASSTSWTLTSTAAIDAGEVGVLRIANDNISTTDGDNSEITSVTGGTGTWEKLGEYTNSQGAAAGGVTVATWLFTPSASNASGTVFTITLASARTQKIAALEKWTVGSGNSLRQTTEAAIVTSQVDAGAGFGSSSFTGLTSLERLYLRVLAGEISTTASVAPTTNFTALSSFRSSTSSPVSVLGEYRVNTSTGETSNPSFTPTADKAGIFFALEEYSTGGGTINGSLSATLGDLSLAGSGALTINGAASATLGAVTSSATGALVIAGNAGVTFGALSVSATGSVSSAPSTNGTASITFGALSASGTARLAITGAASATLGSLSLAGASRLALSGTVSASLGALTASGAGGLTIHGTASVTLSALSVSATGGAFTVPPVNGALNASLGSLSALGEARLGINATATLALGGVTVSAVGGNFSSVQPVRYLAFIADAKELSSDAPIKSLSFIARSGQMQIMPTKYTQEIWVCSLDLSPWIGVGNSVASFAVERISGTATVAMGVLSNATTGQWRVTGGDANTNTVFRAIATMADGQVFAKEFKLFVA